MRHKNAIQKSQNIFEWESLKFFINHTRAVYTHCEVFSGIAGHEFYRNFDFLIEQNQKLSNETSRILRLRKSKVLPKSCSENRKPICEGFSRKTRNNY